MDKKDELIVNQFKNALNKAADESLKTGIQTGINAAFQYLGDCVKATDNGALVLTQQNVTAYADKLKEAEININYSNVEVINGGIDEEEKR